MTTASNSAVTTITDVFDSGVARDLWLLYTAYQDLLSKVATVSMRIMPITKSGRIDFRNLSIETLVPLPSEPKDFADATRLCLLAQKVSVADPSSAAVFYLAPGHNDVPLIKQIDGPAEYNPLLKIVLCRAAGISPRVDPVVPDVPYNAPVEDNDNQPIVPVPAMMDQPFRAEAAGGLLADISRWITSTAIIPVPELSLAASIALIGGLFGGVALTPTRAGINTYLTTLLGTAGGKGHAPKCIRALGDKVRMGAVTNGDPTSFAALERIIRKNPSTTIVMDEFGITLQDVNAVHRNSVAASIRKFLLAVFDQSNSVFDGRTYASSETKKDDSPISGPALSVIGMTTVETLYAGLSEASVRDGFLNRFLFITSAERDAIIQPPKLNADTAPPASLVGALQDAWRLFPRGNPLSTKKTAIPFENGEDGEAYKRWGEVFIWQQMANDDLSGRAAENTIRLATIRALSRDAENPVVNVDDVEWGWAIVHSSIQLIRAGVKKHMSGGPAEAMRKAILSALSEAPKNELAHSELLRKHGVSGGDLRTVEDAVRWLIESGEIVDLNCKIRPGRGSKFRLA